jgi:Uma2 family endonuclease
VWVVYPRARRVHVFRPDGTASVVEYGGRLSGESVIPGFECAIEEIFPPAAAPAAAEAGPGPGSVPSA